MGKDDFLVISGLSIGEKVRLMRLAKNLRQVDVASQAEVSLADVINLEADRTHIVPAFKLEKIIKFLDIENNGYEASED